MKETEPITTAEAAERLAVTPRRIRQLLLEGRLKGIHWGRDWVVDPNSVAHYAAEREG